MIRRSLLAQYLLLVAAYLIVVPLIFAGSIRLATSWQAAQEKKQPDVETAVHHAAEEIHTIAPADRAAVLQRLPERFPGATMFLIDDAGETVWRSPGATVPNSWTPTQMVVLMKQGYDSDPFTVVAPLVPDQVPASATGSVLVLQMPRSQLPSSIPIYTSPMLLVGLAALALILFIVLSWVFFARLRRRLLQLQEAMQAPAEGIPEPISPSTISPSTISPTTISPSTMSTSKISTGTFAPATINTVGSDEVSVLTGTFNSMVDRLAESRERERQEEQLRRQLIASLSHDLRMPLTVIRAQSHTLTEESLTVDGDHAVAVIDEKITSLDRLIDNLLSFTLLAAGKLPRDDQPVDVEAFVRRIVAGWYPAFERAGFTVDVDLPDSTTRWVADPAWLERILDNLLQNVRQHAADGRYLGVSVTELDGKMLITVADHGPGIDAAAAPAGSGLGLGIVSVMLHELGLGWQVQSDEAGTRCTISGPSKSVPT